VHAVKYKILRCGAHNNCDEPGNSAGLETNLENWYQTFHTGYLHSPEQLLCTCSHVHSWDISCCTCTCCNCCHKCVSTCLIFLSTACVRTCVMFMSAMHVSAHVCHCSLLRMCQHICDFPMLLQARAMHGQAPLQRSDFSSQPVCKVSASMRLLLVPLLKSAYLADSSDLHSVCCSALCIARSHEGTDIQDIEPTIMS